MGLIEIFFIVVISAIALLIAIRPFWNDFFEIGGRSRRKAMDPDWQKKEEIASELEIKISSLTNQIISLVSPKRIDFYAASGGIFDTPQEAQHLSVKVLDLVNKIIQMGLDKSPIMILGEGVANVGKGSFKHGITVLKRFLSDITSVARNIDLDDNTLEDGFDQQKFLCLKILGFAEYYQQNFIEAISLLEEGLKMKKQDAESLCGLGLCCLKLDRNEEARDHFAKALKLEKAQGGVKSPFRAVLYANLGEVMRLNEDFEGALASFRKALEINRAVYGDEHHYVVLDLNNIGSLLHLKGDYAGALVNMRKAHEIDKALFKKEHPYVGVDLDDSEGFKKAHENYSMTRNSLTETLLMDKKVFGETHPQVAFRYNNLGLALQQGGDYEEALENFNKALEIYRGIHGNDNLYVATSFINIAQVYYSMKRPIKGLPYIVDAYLIFRKLLGPDHPDTKNARLSIDIYGGDLNAVEKELVGFDNITAIEQDSASD